MELAFYIFFYLRVNVDTFVYVSSVDKKNVGKKIKAAAKFICQDIFF